MAPRDGGWIALHRSLMDHPFWTCDHTRPASIGHAWVDLILMATHRAHVVTHDGVRVSLKRGQLVTSKRALALRWAWGAGSVERLFERLRREGMARCEASDRTDRDPGHGSGRAAGHGFTIVTIENYNSYQRTDDGPSGRASGQEAGHGPGRDAGHGAGHGRATTGPRPTSEPPANPDMAGLFDDVRVPPQQGIQQELLEDDRAPRDRPRGSRKPKKAPTDPRIAEVRRRYEQAYAARFGRAPVMGNFGKLGALTRDALKALDVAGEADALATLEDLLPKYFDLSTRDRFYSGAPLAKFLSTDLLQRLRATGPRAGASPRTAQAIDLARAALAAVVPPEFSSGTVDGAPCELRRDADGSVFATRKVDGAGHALEEEIEAELLRSRNATPAAARAIVARRVRIAAPEGAARA